jgi:hypothetical protein
MSESALKRTAEAVCSALHRNDWIFLGEPGGSRGITWFLRGHENDQLVRIAVERNWEDDNVTLIVQWRNFALAPRVLRGSQELRIDTSKTSVEIERATFAAVHRCLEVFHDVVEQTGVAGKAYAESIVNRPKTT